MIFSLGIYCIINILLKKQNILKMKKVIIWRLLLIIKKYIFQFEFTKMISWAIFFELIIPFISLCEKLLFEFFIAAKKAVRNVWLSDH